MKLAATAPATLLAAVLLAACSTAPAVNRPPSATGAASSAQPARSSPARLTLAQARTAYLRIAGPVNRAASAVVNDIGDIAPFRHLRADELAYAAALTSAGRQLRAIRWPARVQGYVTSVLLTYDPATRACARAVAASGSTQAASNVLSASTACMAAHDASDPEEIRVLLHLPSMPVG